MKRIAKPFIVIAHTLTTAFLFHELLIASDRPLLLITGPLKACGSIYLAVSIIHAAFTIARWIEDNR